MVFHLSSGQMLWLNPQRQDRPYLASSPRVILGQPVVWLRSSELAIAGVNAARLISSLLRWVRTLAVKIFLGSSREALPSLIEVADWLEADGHEPQPWDDVGLLLPGENTFVALVGIARSVDAAIFIFGEDDNVWYRQDSGLKQPRDNVLIEYGLFSGILGQGRVIICRQGEAKLATDIDGITYVDLSSRIRARRAVLAWARLKSRAADDDRSPAILERTILKRELEDVRSQLEFEELKARDLQKLITESGVLDFTSYDGAAGRFKLLFDRDFFWGLASCLASYCSTPIAWRQRLEDRGLKSLSDQIGWHQPQNAGMTQTYIAKVLRLIRLSRPDTGTQWLLSLLNGPDELEAEVDQLVQARVRILRTETGDL
jgi:predicted nucleotide-binding protein